MRRFHGGETVPKGCYVHINNWEVNYITEPQGVLPGERQVSYLKIPEIAIIVLSPFIGLVYVIFLPALTVLVGVFFLGVRLKGVLFGSGRNSEMAVRQKGPIH